MMRPAALFIFTCLIFNTAACAQDGPAPADVSGQSSESILADAEAKADPRNIWDFGIVKEGEVLDHDFEVRNDSQKTLDIKNVMTSCGCTKSSVEKKSLKAGESTPLKIRFDTEGFLGKVTKLIYVQTDDLDNLILTYIIKAEVVE
jgi:hypothetical protein